MSGKSPKRAPNVPRDPWPPHKVREHCASTTWLSVPETAEILGISRQTLNAWINRGSFPAEAVVKSGAGRWLVLSAKLLRFLGLNDEPTP